MVVWMTGLAGSGKTTLAKAVTLQLKQKYRNIIHIDGDDFREILGDIVGYELEERVRNAYRLSRLCGLLEKQSMLVICSTVSLFAEIQEYNQDNFAEYVDVYIHCDEAELFRRDKGLLYSQVSKGEIKNVIGVDIAYDIPINPMLMLDNTLQVRFDNNVARIMQIIEMRVNSDVV